MNKGTVSDIKPGMLVQIEVSSGPDKGIVYSADTDNFNVILLDNSGENLPACIGADEIVCAWDVSQLPTYVLGDILICGVHSSFKSVIENSVVYGNAKAENLELTLEEISEIVSKYLGKSVSVSVKESESGESENDKDEDEVIADVTIGDTINLGGTTYICEKDGYTGNCSQCDLYETRYCNDVQCSGFARRDGEDVHFVDTSVGKQPGNPVSVSVKDSKPDGVAPKTEVFVVPEDGAIARDAQIGEEFEIKGVRYRVIENMMTSNGGCDGCALRADRRCCYYTGRCDADRKDGKSIIFERVPPEDICKSSETADMCKDQKPDTGIEIHNLDEVKPKVYSVGEDTTSIEPAVGDCLKIGGRTYLCIPDGPEKCATCDLLNEGTCRNIQCCFDERADGRNVHFVKIPAEPTDKVIHIAEDERINGDVQIGEEFEIEGDVYRVEEDNTGNCGICGLGQDGRCTRYSGACAACSRSDGKGIVFKRVSAQIADDQKKTAVDTETHGRCKIEPAVGDTIEDDGKKLKVVECASGCVGCYFCDDEIDACKHIVCAARHRKDGTSIILQEVKEEENDHR